MRGSHKTATEARVKVQQDTPQCALALVSVFGKDTRVVYTRIVNTRRIKDPRERQAVERLLQQSKTTTPLYIKVILALQPAAVEDVLYRGMHKIGRAHV